MGKERKFKVIIYEAILLRLTKREVTYLHFKYFRERKKRRSPRACSTTSYKSVDSAPSGWPDNLY